MRFSPFQNIWSCKLRGFLWVWITHEPSMIFISSVTFLGTIHYKNDSCGTLSIVPLFLCSFYSSFKISLVFLGVGEFKLMLLWWSCRVHLHWFSKISLKKKPDCQSDQHGRLREAFFGNACLLGADYSVLSKYNHPNRRIWCGMVVWVDNSTLCEGVECRI